MSYVVDKATLNKPRKRQHTSKVKRVTQFHWNVAILQIATEMVRSKYLGCDNNTGATKLLQ
jgi:hypothetical protein